MSEFMARIAKELGREVGTGDDARRIMKLGTWHDSADETLLQLGLASDSHPPVA